MAKEVWPDLFLGGLGCLYRESLPFQYVANVAAEVQYDADILEKLRLLNITTYALPMFDEESYSLKHTDEFLELLHMLLTNKVKVLVHCMMGVSRSAAVVIRYLIRYHGFTYDTALQRLQSQRWACRPNSGFEWQLRVFEAMVVASKAAENQ